MRQVSCVFAAASASTESSGVLGNATSGGKSTVAKKRIGRLHAPEGDLRDRPTPLRFDDRATSHCCVSSGARRQRSNQSPKLAVVLEGPEIDD